jgi:hypothetical protein
MLAGVSVSGGQEYRRLESDAALLRAIATETGGRVLSLADGGRVFDRGDFEPGEARSPLWRLLLAWALGVLVLDIGTRRVAWDRLVSGAFGADWLRATSALGRQGRAAAGALGALRETGGAKGDQRVHRARGGDVDVSATEADAQRSAHEAQQRILKARAERMAAQAPPPSAQQDTTARHSSSTAEAGPKDAEPVEGGLLAATRRARQRFEDD